MNASPSPTPVGGVRLGRFVMTEKQIAALAVAAPFGLLILGVVAVAVLAAKRKPAAPANTPPPPPPAPPIDVPAEVTPEAAASQPGESPPAPAPSPEPAIPAA